MASSFPETLKKHPQIFPQKYGKRIINTDFYSNYIRTLRSFKGLNKAPDERSKCESNNIQLRNIQNTESIGNPYICKNENGSQQVKRQQIEPTHH